MISIGLRVEEDGVLNISSDMDLSAQLPVKVHPNVEELRIIGTLPDRNAKLVLRGLSETQPCIGQQTNDDMSYGRWSREGYNLKKIILTNVDVTCIPHNNMAFSLGSYGYAHVPEIVLENATLDCPETHGIRYVLYKALPPEGSTKISERMVYCVCENEEDLKKCMTAEQIEWRDKIAEKYPSIAETIDARNSVKSMKHFLECARWDEDIDPMYWFSMTGNSCYWMTLRTCCVLKMDLSKANGTEFLFECDKAEFIRNEYFKIPCEMLDKADPAELVADLIKYWKDNYEMTDEAYEFLYECIPTYYHTFIPNERTHKEEVESFFEEMKCGGFNWYQYITM